MDARYAQQNNLTTGSTVTVAGHAFTVVGLVAPPSGSATTDVYIPLAQAQSLAQMSGQVNTLYVKADSSADIAGVQSEIQKALPDTTVTTSADLADQVTGSLASASSLAKNLGTWLSAAVLAAAVLLASLLTLGAVTRRVREFGTLKALGWRTRRVVAQVMGESLTLGVIGGIGGVLLGLGGAALVSHLSPALTAAAGSPAATGSGAGPGGFARGALGAARTAAHTATVHLDATVTVGAIGLAVALALVAGIVSGGLGGWRAARLRPAAALRRIQ